MGTRFVEAVGAVSPAIPGEHPELTSKMWLGMSVNDDMVEIRKYINGKWFKREIRDPDVVTYVVSRWVTYSEWSEV